MHNALKDKKVVFFDVGYTLDYPASGDWMFINRFYDIAGDKLSRHSHEEIEAAREYALGLLAANHKVKGEEEEYLQFKKYYSDISSFLKLDLTEDETSAIALDRKNNMSNYIIYDDAIEVVEELRKTFRLGIISDTWPSITNQLKTLGLYDYFDTFTYSCDVGVFKPNEKIYLNALSKMGCSPEEAVFIDDAVINLYGAKKLGITPVLIAANPASDVETEFVKIHSLSELIKK